MARKWPTQGLVVLSEREEQARKTRITTDDTLRQDLEDSLRHQGLVYCDNCGVWFQSNCLCDEFRDDYPTTGGEF